MEISKLSRNDLIVLAGFVLAIIGLSLSWYTVGAGLAGIGSIGVTTGWDYGLGVFVFIFTLLAAAIVLLKALPSVKFALPIPEALVVMALGGLSVVFVLIRIIAKPSGAGIVHVGWGFGIFLTLIAVVIVAFGGFLKNSES
jgi:hypothetical protein